MTTVPTGNTYDKYASRNPVERRLMAGFLAALESFLPATAPSTILEVGVGEGEVADRIRAAFPAASFVGIDLPDPELATAWRSRGLPASFADVGRLPFPDRSFDLVLAIEVLEHVPAPMAALDELHRVARDTLVASVPREPIWRLANLARGKYVGDLGNTPGHVQHWSSRSFERLVGSRFSVRAVRRPFPWTMVQARVA